jgi:hypothetical protein
MGILPMFVAFEAGMGETISENSEVFRVIR